MARAAVTAALAAGSLAAHVAGWPCVATRATPWQKTAGQSAGACRPSPPSGNERHANPLPPILLESEPPPSPPLGKPAWGAGCR
jgi:hypothetical protein